MHPLRTRLWLVETLALTPLLLMPHALTSHFVGWAGRTPTFPYPPPLLPGPQNEDAVLTMHRISTFLGIDAAEAHPPKRAKATSDNLCATVINFGALCAAFYPCLEFRAMLDDERNQCRCAGALRASAFAPVASSPYCLVKRLRLLAERKNDGASRYHPSARVGWLRWPLRLRPRGLLWL